MVLKYLKRFVLLNFKIIIMVVIFLVVFLINCIFVMIVIVVMSMKIEVNIFVKENGVGCVSGMIV